MVIAWIAKVAAEKVIISGDILKPKLIGFRNKLEAGKEGNVKDDFSNSGLENGWMVVLFAEVVND